MRTLISRAVTFALIFISCSNQPANTTNKNITANDSTIVGGGCDGCEAIYESPIAFEKLNWIDTLPDYFEPGPKLLVSGTIYKLDGKMPASNVVLYVYHTDQTGQYTKKGNEIGLGKRHGYIRGWIKTNKNGQYKFYTLKPAPYPGHEIPAHIHAIVKEPGLNEYWIDEFVFDDDTLLTTAERKKCENRCGSGIMMLENKGGLPVAERNIILGLHIPNYPQKNISGYQSGLSIGEELPAFDPKHICGPDKNKTKCPMCAYGYGQGILIFWNSKNLDRLWPLLKKLDNEIATQGVKKLRVFAIYTNPVKENLQTVENLLKKRQC
jgi:protocatechuate 3,4-dioxygenase beta subunit